MTTSLRERVNAAIERLRAPALMFDSDRRAIADELEAALTAPASPPALEGMHPDSVRLNWLEHMARHGGLFLYNGVDVAREKATAVGLGLRPGKVDRTLREAIDQASAQS